MYGQTAEIPAPTTPIFLGPKEGGVGDFSSERPVCMIAEPYSETLLAHQEPVRGISEWQDYNDVTGADSLWYEMDLLRE